MMGQWTFRLWWEALRTPETWWDMVNAYQAEPVEWTQSIAATYGDVPWIRLRGMT